MAFPLGKGQPADARELLIIVRQFTPLPVGADEQEVGSVLTVERCVVAAR